LAFNLHREADAVENAVRACLQDGYRTGDIMEPSKTLVGTRKMGALVCERI
jgi:3-isopropylmalate dehydrogenase